MTEHPYRPLVQEAPVKTLADEMREKAQLVRRNISVEPFIPTILQDIEKAAEEGKIVLHTTVENAPEWLGFRLKGALEAKGFRVKVDINVYGDPTLSIWW